MKKLERIFLLRWVKPFTSFACGLVLSWQVNADPIFTPVPEPLQQAAPPASPVTANKNFRSQTALPTALVPAAAYSIGNPTDEEQLYLELINRARANPAAEAERWRTTTDPDLLNAYAYFRTDLNLMAAALSTNPPTPPLSMNGSLTAAARLQSQDMLAHNFQGHGGSDGSDPGSRMSAQNYPWSLYGENVYAMAKSVLHGHAGFEVDWGTGPGGMQDPPGHREVIHYAGFREVGVGVVKGTNGSVGPQLVTQDFSSRYGLTPFITGVVYYDLNGNGFYDLGEGLGGVTVSVAGESSYAVTANSGGYSVPVSGDGAYVVNFSAPNLLGAQMVVLVRDGSNVKVDYVPVYSPPVVAGPNPAAVGQSNVCSFSSVGAATAYEWKHNKRIAYTEMEGAEGGLSNLILAISSDYPVLANKVKMSGSNSFRLAQPQAADQFATLNRLLRPGANSQITFAARLAYATTGQVARAQISTNEGRDWQMFWSLPGNGGAGQTSFVRYTNSLRAYAGQEITLRFMYDYVGGSYYNYTNSGVGFYFDDISVSDAEELVVPVLSNVEAAGSFSFIPVETANYSLRVRGRVGDRLLDWGPAQPISASGQPVRLRLKDISPSTSNLMQVNFEMLSGMAADFQVETSPSLLGPWKVDPTATFTTILPGLQFRALTATGTNGRCYYRVVAK